MGLWTLGRIVLPRTLGSVARLALVLLGSIGASEATAQPGAVDPAFAPVVTSAVNTIAVQADGKILLGGEFTSVGGETRNRIARLNADGTLDTAFNPSLNGPVLSVGVQADGKVLVGGGFTTVGGVAHSGFARLGPNGALESGFNPSLTFAVRTMAVQADGRIVVGGGFTVARLNADGTLDAGFAAGALNHFVFSTALQADGKIIVGGSFTTVGGVARNRIARLNADGTLDTAFNPGAGGDVLSVSVMADGKILLGGRFFSVGGVSRFAIARLHEDGTLDAGFNPSADDTVHSTAVQADGKILLGGDFTLVGGLTRNRIARLNADGTPDPGFISSASGSVLSVTVSADGRILLGGSFFTVGGAPRPNLARLDNDPAPQSLMVPDASRIQWLRGGASPESIQVSFDLSTDGGALYTPLGAGARIAGGWELTGLSLPGSGQVRARARVAGGRNNGSSSLVEKVAGVLREIAVTGNSIEIADGDATPGVSDHTDFGTAPSGSGTVVRTFTILNTGTADLTLGSVTVGGPNAADFAVNTPPPSTVGPGGSVAFQVTFDPSAVGPSSATLSFANDDIDENPFDFSIQGKGASDNADLVQLELDRGTLDPAFDPLTWAYTASVGHAVSSVLATAVAADFTAIIQARVNDGPFQTLSSWVPSAPLALNVGANLVEVRVTAEDGTTVVTYTVTVTRAPLGPGDVDPDFNAAANAAVQAMAMQADEKSILGGWFTALNGTPRNYIGRLNADGTLDTDFNPSASFRALSLAVLDDAKVLVGGSFTGVGGVARYNIARLHADGSLDTGFNAGTDSDIHGIVVQPDGKVVIVGYFSVVGQVEGFLRVGDTPRNRVARLNADGTLDAGFNPNANGTVYAVALQADGKIVIGGDFTTVAGTERHRVARLNTDGSLDPNFDPDVSESVYSVAVQADGKVLLAGVLGSVGGVQRNPIARVGADGTLDLDFNPEFSGFASHSVQSTVVQADGKVLLGGAFWLGFSGGPSNFARLNPNGSVDETLDAGVAGLVYGAALQEDGRIVIGGGFTGVGGVSRNYIARLLNDPATQSLTVPSASRVEWLRSGSSPETQQVTFELSVDGGAVYSPLGPGARINGGWELTGLSLPVIGHIRARARTRGGQWNGSGGLVETVTAFTFPSPIPGITISDATVTEGDTGVSNAVFTLTLSAPSSDTVTVSALTSNLTATAGSDYTAVGPTTVTFAPTVTTQTLSVPVTGDTVLESDESFLVTLSSPVNATIVDDTALGAITNDDGEPPSRVFVSSSGNDTNVCMTQTTPCRNLSAAIGQLAIDGEVIVLTSGEYDTAPILIGKGVKITSPSGTVAFIRQPIVVNAPGARVALRGLTLKGGAASSAITLSAADTLSIEDTTVDGWGVGLDVANGAPSTVAITKTVFQGNQTAVRDVGPGLNRVSSLASRFEGNGTGLSASGGTHTVSECSFAANTIALSVSSGITEISQTQLWSNGTGLVVLSGGTARIGRSHVFGNATGLSAAAGSALASFGSNVIRGNGTNIDGTVTAVPEQ